MLQSAPPREPSRLIASDGRSINGKKGAGVLILCPSTSRFLIGKRGPKGSFPHTWAPFGGMVEDGEDIPVAAIRELYEEANVSVTESQFVSSIPTYIDVIPQAGFEFITYTAVVPNELPGVVHLNPESSGYQWATHSELLSLRDAHPGFRRLMRSEGFSLLLSLLPKTHS